jgi:plastocyanin
MQGSTTGWLIAAIVAVGSLLIVGGMFIGMSMAGHMGGAMMHRSGNVRQTPAAVSAPEVAVEIKDFDYIPRDLTIDVGATVTWTNYDGSPHTATDDDGGWDTGRLGKNETASVQFDEPGEFGYYCVYHPYMQATLIVR